MNKNQRLVKDLKVNDRVKFAEEKISFKVMARNERFLICVKPFNARKTYFYAIVDLVEGIRGADNYHCRFDYEDPSEVKEALDLLVSDSQIENYGDAFYISSRNQVKLRIDKVIIK